MVDSLINVERLGWNGRFRLAAYYCMGLGCPSLAEMEAMVAGSAASTHAAAEPSDVAVRCHHRIAGSLFRSFKAQCHDAARAAPTPTG